MSGGWSNRLLLKSVETFHYYENKWTYLPDMIVRRSHHALVSMGINLFIVLCLTINMVSVVLNITNSQLGYSFLSCKLFT